MAKRICDPTSGSIGRQVYGIGRNGQFVRARVVPANPNTTFQAAVRSRLASVSRRWDSITQNQQLAWIVAGSSQQTRKVLGMSGPLTGNQLFVRVNTNLAEFGNSEVDVPPTLPTFPALAPAGLVITNTVGAIALKLTCPADPGEDTIVAAAAPVANGVHRAPEVVVIGACPAPAQGSSNITGLYTSRFGVPAVGQKVFVSVYQTLSGYDEPALTFSAIVPAA